LLEERGEGRCTKGGDERRKAAKIGEKNMGYRRRWKY
jgi:hypothetical protein